MRIGPPEGFGGPVGALHLFSGQRSGDGVADCAGSFRDASPAKSTCAVACDPGNAETGSPSALCLGASGCAATLGPVGDCALPGGAAVAAGGGGLEAGADYACDGPAGEPAVRSPAIAGGTAASASAALSGIAAPDSSTTSGGGGVRPRRPGERRRGARRVRLGGAERCREVPALCGRRRDLGGHGGRRRRGAAGTGLANVAEARLAVAGETGGAGRPTCSARCPERATRGRKAAPSL